MLRRGNTDSGVMDAAEVMPVRGKDGEERVTHVSFNLTCP